VDALTPMRAQDSLWLTMDRPNNLMIIDGVMIIAGKPTYEAVQEVVRSRVTDRYPVYRRTPVRSGGGRAWRDDPDFDVSRHIERVTLPEPADIPALSALPAATLQQLVVAATEVNRLTEGDVKDLEDAAKNSPCDRNGNSSSASPLPLAARSPS